MKIINTTENEVKLRPKRMNYEMIPCKIEHTRRNEKHVKGFSNGFEKNEVMEIFVN